MYSGAQLFTIRSLTPIHPGSGNSLAYVDLPIQRERHTSFPMIAGSSLKGVIRDLARRTWNDEKVKEVFGSEETGKQASQVGFTDAKILFYPVRSVRGIFALVTCPYVLQRFVNEVKSIVNQEIDLSQISLADNEAICSSESVLFIDPNQKTQIGLEEFLFQAKQQNDLNNLFQKLGLSDEQERIAIISDSVFTDLVNYAVDVRTRISIDQSTGVVKNGALFVVEMVPSEAIFYAFVLWKNNQESIQKLLKSTKLHVGGDETTGSGIVQITLQNLS